MRARNHQASSFVAIKLFRSNSTLDHCCQNKQLYKVRTKGDELLVVNAVNTARLPARRQAPCRLPTGGPGGRSDPQALGPAGSRCHLNSVLHGSRPERRERTNPYWREASQDRRYWNQAVGLSKSRIKTKNPRQREGREHRVLYRRELESLSMCLWRVCGLAVSGSGQMPDGGEMRERWKGLTWSLVVLPGLW